MIIQLATVSHSSDPTEYWDNVRNCADMVVLDIEKDFYVKEFDSIKQCWETCDRHNIIVSETNTYRKELHPVETDCCVRVYDGYNE